MLGALMLVTPAGAQQAFDMSTVQSAVGERFVSGDFVDQPDFKKLMVDIKIAGLDGANLDFYNLGKDVLSVAKVMENSGIDFDYLDVMITVPAYDKFGNPIMDDAGTITWKADDLAQLNPETPQPFLFPLATEASLHGLGTQMAQAYCQRWKLRDPRYCS